MFSNSDLIFCEKHIFVFNYKLFSGICVDWLTSDVYWAEKTSGLIIFINERFPMEMPLFQNVDNPFSLTIDPHNRYRVD